MKWYRILALTHRYVVISFRDFNNFLSLIYWPILDIILWGFNSVWMQENQASGVPISLVLVTSIVLWQVVTRGSIDVAYSVLDEIWSHNLVNIFAAPVKVGEWIIAVILSTIIKILFTLSLSALIAWLIYGISIFTLGWWLVLFVILLTISGLTLGLITASGIIYWGRKIEVLTWIMNWIFAPLSAVFYPLHVLPFWVQNIAQFIPMAHLFEGMRLLLTQHFIPAHYLVMCCVLNLIYFSLALILFKYMFEKSRNRGLARL